MILYINITQLHSLITMASTSVITSKHLLDIYDNLNTDTYTKSASELLTFDEWKTAMAAVGNAIPDQFLYATNTFDLSPKEFMLASYMVNVDFLRDTEYSIDDVKTVRICSENRYGFKIYIELKNDDVVEFAHSPYGYMLKPNSNTTVYCVRQTPGCFLPLNLRMFKKDS